jgi:hypothetical protein
VQGQLIGTGAHIRLARQFGFGTYGNHSADERQVQEAMPVLGGRRLRRIADADQPVLPSMPGEQMPRTSRTA